LTLIQLFYTIELPPWNEALHGEERVPQLVKTFAASYWIRRLNNGSKISYNLPVSWARWMQSTSSYPISL